MIFTAEIIYPYPAIPHRAISDDEFRGYDIPEGCMIMPNIWSVAVYLIPYFIKHCINPYETDSDLSSRSQGHDA